MTDKPEAPLDERAKLLPCPFCGGKAAYVPRAVNIVLQKDPSDPKFGVSVICGTCSAETGNFIDEAAAALRWNRRAASQEWCLAMVEREGDKGAPSAGASPSLPLPSDLSEPLKLEAQCHAQEARTANATIAEIYQLVTGATGEPGNWNGAEPVRAYIAEQRGLLEQVLEALDGCVDTLEMASDFYSDGPTVKKATAAIAAIRSRLPSLSTEKKI